MRGRKHILSYKSVPIWLMLIAAFSLILFYTSETEALSIEFTNYTIIDFGEMNPGDIKDDAPYDGLIIRCTASSGTPGWTLKVKIEHPLTHESNLASMIPNTNFKWYVESTTGSIANISPGVNNEVEFTDYDTLVYTGSAGEGQTDIKMKFMLELPQALQWGTYSTNYGRIVFTLTE